MNLGEALAIAEKKSRENQHPRQMGKCAVWMCKFLKCEHLKLIGEYHLTQSNFCTKFNAPVRSLNKSKTGCQNDETKKDSQDNK
jgi:hypothetical protein